MTTAAKMITKVPAQILGLNKGTLAEGMDADIVAFDEDVQMHKVIINGAIC